MAIDLDTRANQFLYKWSAKVMKTSLQKQRISIIFCPACHPNIKKMLKLFTLPEVHFCKHPIAYFPSLFLAVLNGGPVMDTSI